MRVRLWVKRITRRFGAMAPAMFMPARSLDLSVPNASRPTSQPQTGNTRAADGDHPVSTTGHHVRVHEAEIELRHRTSRCGK
jgi:hypothetical protein